ncbi:hypothetical protein Bca101_057552 [Brassica carinata]
MTQSYMARVKIDPEAGMDRSGAGPTVWISGVYPAENASSHRLLSSTADYSFAPAFIMVVSSFRGSRRHVAFGNLKRHVTLASIRSTPGYVARKSGSKVIGAVDQNLV